MIICFARHGQTEQNRLKKIQGQRDFPLNDTGKEEAHLLGKWIKDNDNNFDIIMSSPLTRALETAQIIKEEIDFKDDVIINEAFIERCFGVCEGLDVCDEVFVDILNDRAEGLEKTYEIRSRVISECKKLAKMYPEKKILVVSHSHAIKALSTAIDISYRFNDRLNNCSLSYFEFTSDNMKILDFNVKTI